MASLWAPWNPLVAAALYPPPEDVMFRCIVCHFEVQLDDVEVPASHGRNCVCVRCFHRETGTEKALDKRSREEWQRVVNSVEGA